MVPAPEVSVLLPTLNEAGSLRAIAARLLAAVEGTSTEFVVIDDASTDGTGAVVEALARTGPFRLLERAHERGLSSAVLAGIAASTGRIVVVMDADGSHPPELIPTLVAAVGPGGAEFALASRHVPGGDMGPMTRSRRWISAGASWLARPLAHVRDPMSGYFAVRREILGRATLRPLGFKIALEILVKCRPDPVVELPLVFQDRVYGESKLGSRVIGSYLRHVARLYAWRISGGPRASRTR